ncbi:MAG TPA: hypothetical protein DCE18_15620 [Syntrophobacteraceae bacterium]|nr:hypothetical protein [Syntrophobacteraceae bacterium]
MTPYQRVKAKRVARYNQHLARMRYLDPNSPEWETERQGLYHQRRRMREEGYGIPDNLQPVPSRERKVA